MCSESLEPKLVVGLYSDSFRTSLYDWNDQEKHYYHHAFNTTQTLASFSLEVTLKRHSDIRRTFSPML